VETGVRANLGARQRYNFQRVFTAARLLLPRRFAPRPAPPVLPLPWPPRPRLVLDPPKSSVDDFVFCFERLPALPNPNFLSRACRGNLALLAPLLPRFAGRSEMASSTATSNASSSASALSRAPLRSDNG
jgi:hypothetical protein